MIQNLILMIAGLIGFLTAAVTLKNRKLNNVMNIYMILIIITISARYFLLGTIHFVTDDLFIPYYVRYSNFSLVVIPLFYLYAKNLSNRNIVFDKKELLHFVFPVCFFLFMVNMKIFQIEYTGIKYIYYSIFFLYLSLYLYLSYRILKQNIWLKKDAIKVIKKQNIVNSSWTYFLSLAIFFIVIRLLGSMYFELHYGISMRGYPFLWISASIWLLILFKILISPEILYGYDVLNKKLDENRTGNLVLNSIWNTSSKIQINNEQHLQLKEKIDSNILNYIEKIEEISINDKIFRDPTITIVDLANKLNLPKSHITYLFKYHSTISFSEYKKAIRIQDAIHLINEDYLKENTLDYLSKNVGFPSYNTFFTSFKSITGHTPQKYIDQLNE